MINPMNDLIKQNDILMSKKSYQAVIVDNKDPDKKGRVKIRVSGVHPDLLNEKELPWTQVQPELGANQGQGSKKILQIGQFCTVEPLNWALSEWIVVSGSGIVREELNEKETEKSSSTGSSSTGSSSTQNEITKNNNKPFSNIKNKTLEKEIVPKLASTIKEKLNETVYGTIMSKLVKMGDLKNINPNPLLPSTTPSPTLPPLLKIIAKEVDFKHEIIYSAFGKDLGTFNESYYYYTDNPDISMRNATTENTIVELLNAEEMIGYDLEGNKVYPKIENGSLIIPPNLPYGENTTDSKEYFLKYKVTDKENEYNISENTIIFRISGIDYVIAEEPKDSEDPEISINESNETNEYEEYEETVNTYSGLFTTNSETSNGVKIATTPKYAFDEFKPEDEKGVTEHKEINQLPNGIAISLDGSEDNAYVSFKHPTGTRLDMFNDGRSILKSCTSMQLVQGQNLLVNTGNTAEISVATRINLKTPKLYIECDTIEIQADQINIKGNLDMVGNINMEGNITLFGNITQTGNQQIYGNVNVTGGDIVADGISLKEHVHTEQGDYKDVSKPK